MVVVTGMKKILIAFVGCATVFAPIAFAQRQPEVTQRIFADADLNHDGYIDLAEFHKDIVNSFHRLDLNRDGYISIAEIRSIPDQRRVELLLAVLRKADTNHDSRLSFKEVVTARMKFFDAADRDHDDRLSLAEVIEYDAGIDEKVAGAEVAAAKAARSAKKK